jgi:4-nitrophenyl phosphatase
VRPAQAAREWTLTAANLNNRFAMLPQLKALLIDLDGVMCRGMTVLPGAREAIPTLRRLGIRYAFVTNNATLTPEQNAERLVALGVPAVPEDFVTSALAVAAYLRSLTTGEATVCVVGEGGVVQALEDAGFRVGDAKPDFVVVGLDRNLTYQRLVAALRGIRGGAQLIATNVDRALPVDDGLAPGAGSIVAAVATAADVQPIVIGKPEPTLLQVALDRLDVAPRDAAIVGDQIATDIRAGKAAGIRTILVEGDLATPSGGIEPDLTVRDLAQLLALLEESAREST